MKLTVQLLIITAWHMLIIAARSVESADVDQEALLKRAADQLDRLMPYRKNDADDRAEIDLTKLLETWKTVADQNHLDETKGGSGNADGQLNLPWEMLEIQPNQASDAMKRTDDGKADDEMIRIDVITDPQYAALMRDRIKRGFNHGTASLLTSIAGGVLSGVASASSSSAGKVLSSSSSAEYGKPYGAPVEHSYSYDEKHFGPWDFKKAIFGTLFQALKAIGGGVLALKGQLVKGSGYLLAAKSKVFGKTGDAITSFGKHLAASALSKPHPETYYDHSSIQHIEHDHGYHGPPGSDDYTEDVHDYSPHKTYGVPSDAVVYMLTYYPHPVYHKYRHKLLRPYKR